MNINKRIEGLLNAYYDGNASPADISELREIFMSAGTLSPELETERTIFLAIEGSRPDSDRIPIPGNLQERLGNAIDSLADADNLFEEPRRRKKPFYARIAISAAAAAAIILIATFSWRAIDYAAGDIDLSTHPIMLEASVNNTDEKEDTTVSAPSDGINASDNAIKVPATDSNEPPAPVPTKGSYTKKASAHKRYVAKASTNSPSKRRHANIRVVTNPEEALLLADQAMTLLQKNVQNAQFASDKTDIAIESIINDINRIDL